MIRTPIAYVEYRRIVLNSALAFVRGIAPPSDAPQGAEIQAAVIVEHDSVHHRELPYGMQLPGGGGDRRKGVRPVNAPRA